MYITANEEYKTVQIVLVFGNTVCSRKEYSFTNWSPDIEGSCEYIE